MAGQGNAAYDFSRFEERKVESAEVINFEEHLEAQKPRKTFRHVLRAFAVFAVIAVLAGPLIYNEMQLNELNISINRGERALNEANNEYIQIEMQAEARVSTEEVERYAKEVLGMQKLQPGQVIYIHVNNEDKFEVMEENDTGFLSKIAEWFSGIFSGN